MRKKSVGSRDVWEGKRKRKGGLENMCINVSVEGVYYSKLTGIKHNLMLAELTVTVGKNRNVNH